MTEMTDLRPTIVPKSDQLNADDLIGGRTITIKVTKVSLCGELDQPIAVHYEGDGGKPYKPCKSMRRVLVNVWGEDGNAFVGRRMTLYRDDEVRFGGLAVGGIRISHMSDIDRDVTMALTASKANRKAYTVRVLRPEPGGRPAAAGAQATTPAREPDRTDQPVTLSQRADVFEGRVREAPTTTKLTAIRNAAVLLRKDLDVGDPERLAELDQLWQERFDALEASEREAGR